MTQTRARSTRFVTLFSGALLGAGWLAGCGSGDDPETTSSTTAGTGGISNGAGGGDGCPGKLLRCAAECIDVRFDPDNCGACGNACEVGEVCSQGTCSVTCNGGTVMCDAAGKEVCADLANDPANCGACGTVCAAPNAKNYCADSACTFSCELGFEDCDGQADNGCEADLVASAVHCGECGNVCETPAHALPGCALGVCGIGMCDAGYDDCDGKPDNGCEAALDAPSNCGTCGNVCDTLAHATPGCSMGACEIGACDQGYDDCDGKLDNGCEIQTAFDAKNCGACGKVCKGAETCASGTCVLGCPGALKLGSVPMAGVGFWPHGLVPGDFNGDGKLDVAIDGGNQPKTLLGIGDGTFKGSQPLANNDTRWPVTAGDFNGDGALDVVLGQHVASSLQLILSDGNGAFKAPVALSCDNFYCFRAFATDFNGDTLLDLAVPLSETFSFRRVRILRGLGDGTFKAPIDVDIWKDKSGPDLDWFEVADFTGDGKLDLLVGLSKVTILSIGNGDATFQSPVTLLSGVATENARSGDFNADGKRDLVTAARFIPGFGDGTFGTSIPLPGTAGQFVLVGDFDSDGQLDLLRQRSVAKPGANETLSVSVEYLHGQGDGTFVMKASFALNPGFQLETATDVNADGKTDVLGRFYDENGAMFTLLGRGDGTFALPSEVATGTGVEALVATDLDGDGKPDLATADAGSGTVSVLLNQGSGALKSASSYPVGSSPRGLVASDLDDDGKLDLAVTNHGSSSVSVLVNKGDGTFKPKVDLAVGAKPRGVTSGDFDANGKRDLAVANNFGDSVSVLLSDGAGGFIKPKVDLATGPSPTGLVAADLNADGKLDLVAANFDADSVSLLLGNGDGTFLAKADFAVGDRPLGLAAGDIDGDGKLDLVTANESDTASVLLGNGNGTFKAKSDYAMSSKVDDYFMLTSGLAAVALADLDGDGRLDVLGSRGGRSVSLLRGKGDGTFFPALRYIAGNGASGLAAFDIDGNGKLDLVTANKFGDSVSVLLHGGCL